MTIKNVLLYSILYLCLSFSMVSAQAFRVIGYLPDSRFSYHDQIDYTKLTHLCIAFANPDSEGAWTMESEPFDKLPPILQRAKSFNLKTYLSIAGGGISETQVKSWAKWIAKDKRADFIHRLLVLVDQYGFDGVDVDLEWDAVNVDYSPFVLALKDSLMAHNKGMTAALPATTRYAPITNEALAAFDFINIMAYDATGPWDAANAGQHSSYEFAEQSIEFWLSQGVPATQLNLGVPFYGYNFGQTPVDPFAYRDMVNRDSFNAYLDRVGNAYYNGIPTMRAKALLAKKKVGGIMIWELGQDTFQYLKRFSLLKTIDDAINAPSAPDVPTQLSLYPNPTSDMVYVESPLLPNATVMILDILGREMFKSQVLDNNRCVMNVRHLPTGMYIVRVIGETETTVKTFIKK